jgi:hypothetical protein
LNLGSINVELLKLNKFNKKEMDDIIEIIRKTERKLMSMRYEISEKGTDSAFFIQSKMNIEKDLMAAEISLIGGSKLYDALIEVGKKIDANDL